MINAVTEKIKINKAYDNMGRAWADIVSLQPISADAIIMPSRSMIRRRRRRHYPIQIIAQPITSLAAVDSGDESISDC